VSLLLATATIEPFVACVFFGYANSTTTANAACARYDCNAAYYATYVSLRAHNNLSLSLTQQSEQEKVVFTQDYVRPFGAFNLSNMRGRGELGLYFDGEYLATTLADWFAFKCQLCSADMRYIAALRKHTKAEHNLVYWYVSSVCVCVQSAPSGLVC
jgi:hypothetical protein